MELYHASNKVFSIGDKITPEGVSSFYEKATDTMDSGRPKSAPARKTALYSADSLDFAFYFMLKQGICEKEINLYKVEVKDPWKAAFSITHIIHRRLEQGKNTNSLVREYWSPTKDWQFYEYLSISFVVIDEMEHIPANMMWRTEMQFKALRDYDLAESIC